MASLRPTIYPLPLIGWRERVHLPKLGLGPLIAKIDTGARTAALHAEDIVIRGSHVRFAIPNNGRKHHYELPIKGQRRVKSTSGHSEMRAGGNRYCNWHVKFTAEITLTNRTTWVFPCFWAAPPFVENSSFTPEAHFLFHAPNGS